MKRLTATMAIVIGVLIFGFAATSALGATASSPKAAAVAATNQTNWNGVRGANNLPCTGGTLHWIFTGGDKGSFADIYINGVLADGGDQAGPTPGNGAWHFFNSSAGVTSSTDVHVVSDGMVGGLVTISSCAGGTTTTTVTVPTTVTHS